MSDQVKGVLLTMLGVMSFVPDSLMIRLMDADTMTIVFWRALFTGCVITTGVVIVYRRKTLSHVRDVGWPGLFVAVLLSTSTILFVVAVQWTTVANTLFIISTSPIFSALFSRMFLKERISRRMLWTIALALIGILIIAYGSLGSTDGSLVGDLAALGVAVALGAWFTIARAMRRVPIVSATGLSFLLGAAVVYVFASPMWLVGDDWMYVGLVGLLFLPLGTSLISIGPRYITAAEVALILLLEAVLAPLLVWAVLGEVPGDLALVGGAVVLGVLLVSNMIGLRRHRQR